MKDRRGIGEAEGHYGKLIMAIVCAKRCLLDIWQMYEHLVVASVEVKLCEYCGSGKLIEKLCDSRDEKLIFDGGRVEFPIININMLTPIFLLN